MGELIREQGKGYNRRDFLKYSAGAAATVALGSIPNIAKANSKPENFSNDIVDSLLQGAIEMHVHGAPDVVPRKMTDLGVVRSYKQAGLKGVLIKCHVTSTTSRVAIAREATGNFYAFGGLVLNKMVGGLNPVAVETELKLGAKQIWMPTISAANHIRFEKGKMSEAVTLTEDNGSIRDELYEIFDLIAAKDAILGTGHLSSDECETIVSIAKERGIKKILITHPEYVMPGMPVEVQKKLALKDVMFERCFYASNSFQKLPPEIIANQIKAVGADVSIIATDFGQAFNDEPLVGFKRYIRTMLNLSVSAKDIELMVKKNPSQLLGI